MPGGFILQYIELNKKNATSFDAAFFFKIF